jgi:hypothetical protein
MSLSNFDSSRGRAIRNFSLKSAKFLGSYFGSIGTILDRSKVIRGDPLWRDDLEDELDEIDGLGERDELGEVGPSPALLLEKPLPRARVRPTEIAE